MTTSTARRTHDTPADKARAAISLSAAATVLLIANAAFAAPASCSSTETVNVTHAETDSSHAAHALETLRTED